VAGIIEALINSRSVAILILAADIRDVAFNPVSFPAAMVRAVQAFGQMLNDAAAPP
jgi:hypothetical protein